MPTPDFISRLRADIGHDLLWLPGVSVVVFDETDRVLLHQRADDRRWALISGIPEPGEQPAATAVREVFEETAVRCLIERLVAVHSEEPMSYTNGDVCQFVNICFSARAVDGAARVADDESLAVGWFEPHDLPEGLSESHRFRIECALAPGPTWFERPPA